MPTFVIKSIGYATVFTFYESIKYYMEQFLGSCQGFEPGCLKAFASPNTPSAIIADPYSAISSIWNIICKIEFLLKSIFFFETLSLIIFFASIVELLFKSYTTI